MKPQEDAKSSLQNWSESIAEAWYDIIRPACAARLSAVETRRIVNQLGERVVRLLFEMGCYSKQAVKDLASQLLSLRLSPEALAKLEQVLLCELTEIAPSARAGAAQVSPARLVADLTAALLRGTEATILEEQEDVRRAYATALQLTERRLRLMDAAVEASVTAVALWTLEGEIIYVNPAFLTLWNCDDCEAFLSKHISTLWAEDQPFDAIEAFLEEAGGWIGKLQTRREGGDRSPVMLAASVVEPDDDAPPFVIGCFLDMTYRERLKTMLWNAVDRLKTLRQVDRGILTANSPQAIAQAALRHIRQLIPCQRASVSLFRPGDERATFLAATPKTSYEAELETGMRLAGFEDVLETLERNEVHIIDDVRHLPLPPSARRKLQRRTAHTAAVVPLHCEGEVLGALNLAFASREDVTEQHISIAREVADSLAVAIRHAQLDQAIADHRARLRDLAARLAEADEAERRRLARDLHDQIGQKLTALGINLNVVKARLDAETAPELISRLDDSLELLKETTERVRRVIADLRPPMLDDYGLLPTLRWCGEQLKERMDVDVVVQGKEPEPRLGSPVEDALVRITQEALTNVLKHAQASRVTITLSQPVGALRLEIADDGGGFAPDAVEDRDRQKWGLTTMMERAEAIGGCCRIASQPGEGTKVIVEVS